MTREEQILNAAQEMSLCTAESGCYERLAFVQGARWADANQPSKYFIKIRYEYPHNGVPCHGDHFFVTEIDGITKKKVVDAIHKEMENVFFDDLRKDITIIELVILSKV